MLHFINKLFRTAAKITLVGAILIIIISAFITSTTNSRPAPPSKDLAQVYREKNEKLLSDLEKKSPEHKLMISSYRLVTCAIVGETCATESGYKNSLLGRAAGVATYTYTHPASSGIRETYNTLAGAGLAPQTHAAEGIGFASISGFRTVWLVFRNVAYSILVVVMVVVSFMIMFRMKLSAQTEIKIQSALPRIVFSLILITFSYAIAGFLIDLMYVVMGLSIALLCNNDMYCNSAETINRYYNASAGTIFTSFFPYDGSTTVNNPGSKIPFIGGLLLGIGNIWMLSNSILTILPPSIMSLVYLLGAAGAFSVTSALMSLYSDFGLTTILSNFSAFTFSPGDAPKGIIGIILGVLSYAVISMFIVPFFMMLLILMTIVYLFFRIFFMILAAYTQILLYIIFAPLFMLLEAIPGQSGFSSWFKNLLGELLTFPIVSSLFVVGSLIVNNFQPPGAGVAFNSQVWQPPFLAGIEQESFLLVVGMAIIFLIPDLVKIVKDSLGAKGMGINFGMGNFFMGAAAGFGGATGLMGKGLGMMNTFGGPGTAKDFLAKHVGPVRDQLFKGRDFRGPPPEGLEKFKAYGRNEKQNEISKMETVARDAKKAGKKEELAFKDEFGDAKYKEIYNEYKGYKGLLGPKRKMDAIRDAGEKRAAAVAESHRLKQEDEMKKQIEVAQEEVIRRSNPTPQTSAGGATSTQGTSPDDDTSPGSPPSNPPPSTPPSGPGTSTTASGLGVVNRAPRRPPPGGGGTSGSGGTTTP